jgi:hypothetical protein
MQRKTERYGLYLLFNWREQSATGCISCINYSLQMRIGYEKRVF